MKKAAPSPFRANRTLIALLATTLVPAAFADFIPKDAGPYVYTDTANWDTGTINNTWNNTNNVSPSITADQTITFTSDYTQTSNWTINNLNAFNHTFRGQGGDRILTLGGNISLGSSTTNANKVTVGSSTSGQALHINLGSTTRIISTSTNRTLEIINVVSGSAGITKQGTGTLILANTANSFTGNLSLGASGQAGGTVVVTKLADGGAASSIGAGTGNIGFGGNATGTLRYVGTGDSTNRGFLIGGSGAIIDASGTGALNFTNASAQTNGSTGTARTFTLTGTSTAENTMGASFTNAGTGGTVSLLKQGAGKWVLSGNNSYTGTTTIDAGTLALGGADRIGNSSTLVLNGGTFSTGGFSETLGTLKLTANSIIDLGNNVTGSALAFANSATETWTPSVSLSIVNFTDGTDSVFFGVDGLSGDQLAQIRINGTHYALLSGSGFLSLGAAIPEPSAFALLAGIGSLFLAATRRRRAA
jgi:fibronectin-binding autotransporter adhesin